MMLPKQYDSHINVVMEDSKLLYVKQCDMNKLYSFNRKKEYSKIITSNKLIFKYHW